MFSKEDETHAPAKSSTSPTETVIGPTVKVEGTFNGEDNVLVEGMVVGTLHTTHNLTVSDQATIEADVTAENMHISGTVKGNLKASDTITLTKSARIYGDVETNIISVETGAVIQGRCITGEQGRTEDAPEEVEVSEKETDEAND